MMLIFVNMKRTIMMTKREQKKGRKIERIVKKGTYTFMNPSNKFNNINKKSNKNLSVRERER